MQPALLVGSSHGTNASIGAQRGGEPPVPMPNTEVKPSIGYNTWVIKPWEDSTVPIYKERLPLRGSFFVRVIAYLDIEK